MLPICGRVARENHRIGVLYYNIGGKVERAPKIALAVRSRECFLSLNKCNATSRQNRGWGSRSKQHRKDIQDSYSYSKLARELRLACFVVVCSK